MWIKIKTEDESKNMSFYVMSAHLINKNDINSIKSSITTDFFIKKIAKLNNNFYYLNFNKNLLIDFKDIESVDLNSKSTDLSSLKVLVPSFQPLTQHQILQCKNHWPIKKRQIEKIKINKDSDLLINEVIKEYSIEINTNFVFKYKCCANGIFYHKNKILIKFNDNKNLFLLFFKDIKIKDENYLDYHFGHGILKGIEKISQSYEESYLCNGISLYLYQEPCEICCMALIHSRIKEVYFYKESNGIYTKKRFSYKKELNHRHCVYKYEI